MAKIDSVDMFILENLQRDGRMTNVELSSRAGISAPPCLRRLKWLEKSGIIKGYYADIDGTVLGYRFKAVCFVSLRDQSYETVDEFTEQIRDLHCIRQCSRVVGDFDFILFVIAKDLNEYEKFVTGTLSKLSTIKQVKTYPIMKEIKDEKGFPLPQFNNDISE